MACLGLNIRVVCVSVYGVSQVLEVWALLGHLLESNQGLADALRGFVRQLAANLKDAGDKVSHSAILCQALLFLNGPCAALNLVSAFAAQ